MADAKPDYFPAPFQDQQQHDRRTPESMGGSRGVYPPPAVAAPGRLPIDPRAAQAARRAAEALTRALPITGSAIVPASGPTVIDMGGPEVGFVWDLKSIILGPEDMTVLPYATGITTVLYSRAQSAAADTTPTNAVWLWNGTIAGTFPACATFGRHEAHAESGENFQLVVIGATAGTLLIAGGTVEQTGADRSIVWSE